MKKIILILLILTTLLGCKSVTKEEAIAVTQDFVNSHVRVFVNEEENTQVVSEAKINILATDKVKNDWYLAINIQSNDTGTVKQTNLFFIVDGKSAEVKDWGKLK